MRIIIGILGLMLAASPAAANIAVVIEDPLPGGARTSFDGVSQPTPTSPFTVALRGDGGEVAALVEAVGYTHWLYQCAEGDCRVYSWAAGNPAPSGTAKISFTPAVARVALRIDDCASGASTALTVTVVGATGSESASPGCQIGKWISVTNPPGGTIRELRVLASYGGAFDDLTVAFVPAAPADLALSASAQRSGATATLSFVARHVSGAAALGATLAVLLPDALRGTTSPADEAGVIQVDTPLSPRQSVPVTVTSTPPPKQCEESHLVVGVVRENVEPNIADNIATAVVWPDPASAASREDCAADGDEDCDGFLDCSDRDCSDDEACSVAPSDIADGNPPEDGMPALPILFPPIVILPADPPDSVCTVYIRGEARPAPAYCCQAAPALGTPLYTRFFNDCPPRDPNFKESSPPVGANGVGWTRAGERISYTVHYENIGASDAHGVEIIDVLDPDLDAATLEIEDGGHYDAATRTLLWIDPVVFPMDPREVHFAARVRGDADPGTRVRNVATIVFPDAFPPTRIDTNLVEHVIPSPGHSIAPRLFVARCTPGGAANAYRVELANWGLVSAYNARVRAVFSPTDVQIIHGLAEGFAAARDVAPAEMGSVVPFAATPSAGFVELVAPAGVDPCPRMTWEITYQSADGAAHTEMVRLAACTGDPECGAGNVCQGGSCVAGGPGPDAGVGGADGGAADAGGPVDAAVTSVDAAVTSVDAAVTSVDAAVAPLEPSDESGCSCTLGARRPPRAPIAAALLAAAALWLVRSATVRRRAAKATTASSARGSVTAAPPSRSSTTSGAAIIGALCAPARIAATAPRGTMTAMRVAVFDTHRYSCRFPQQGAPRL